jgi:hypothetical protein
MITDSVLEKLASFGKEEDGCYCDRWQFSIYPKNKERTAWELRFFSEWDGSTWHIKYLKDLEDLKNVYKAITNDELLFLNYFATDGRGFVKEEECKYHQSILDGEIRECENCFGSGNLMISEDKVEDKTLIIKERLFGKHVIIKCVECDGVGHFKIGENDRSS